MEASLAVINLFDFFYRKLKHTHVHGSRWERGAVERAQAQRKCCRRCTTWGRCRECSYRMRSSLGCCPRMSRPSLSGISPKERGERREAFSRASLLLYRGNAGACELPSPACPRHHLRLNRAYVRRVHAVDESTKRAEIRVRVERIVGTRLRHKP